MVVGVFTVGVLLLASVDVVNILLLSCLLKSKTRGTLVTGLEIEVFCGSGCVIAEFGLLLGEEFFWIPWAAHFASNFAFDFEPGGRPTVKIFL